MSGVVPRSLPPTYQGTVTYLRCRTQLPFVSNDENVSEPRGGESGDASGIGQSRTWVVASSDRACDHRREDLRIVGDDGINGYYRCVRCDAVVVSQDELAELARASRTGTD